MHNLRFAFFAFAISLLCFSCALPKVYHVYESPKSIVINKGNWLVNYIDADFLAYDIKEAETRSVLTELKKIGFDSIAYAGDQVFEYLLPQDFKFNLTPDKMKVLCTTTEYDYLLSIKLAINADEINDLYLSAPEVTGKSESEVYFVIHNICTGEQVYFQKVIATIALSENDEDVRLAKSGNSLIYTAINNGLKDIGKYAIKE